MNTSTPRVGLYITCLVNAMRPNIGMAAVKLLREAGCEVAVPSAQTCCGQPATNSGDDASGRRLAKQLIAAFENFDYVVAPSGSCVASMRAYPALLADEAAWHARATHFAAKVWELLSFLDEVCNVQVKSAYDGCVSYHDSCSGLRELGIKRQPRRLLSKVVGLELKEMADTEVCCGFGGTFCVKYPAISAKMVDDKIRALDATGADTLLGGDLGCLLNIGGRLSRQHKTIKVYHAAEVLAGMTDEADNNA